MSDIPLLTILHISDFHFSRRRWREQQIVVDALIKDLEVLCIGHRKPDLIMFTGDLVYAAGIDPHDEAYDFLLDRVSKATGCSDERIFITPGNHDLSWTGLEKFSAATKEWREIVGRDDEVDKFNTLFQDRAFDQAIEAKFRNYNDLDDYVSGGDRGGGRRLKNAFVTVDHLEALNVDVIVFNTAVLSAGGNKNFSSDNRKLIIPEYAIREAVSVLKPDAFHLFVTHHPLSWLSEQSARFLNAEIARHAQIHLYGHMHDPQPGRLSGLTGEVVTDQAGALFTARNTYNGYALLTIDRQNGAVETSIRSYFKDRSAFDEGIDIIEGGRWWSSNTAKQHFRKIATPVDEEKFRAHLCGEALDALCARERSHGGEGDVHITFVPPPLTRTFIQEVKGDEVSVEGEIPIPFSVLTGSDANIILYAKAEYGRTTLLRELRYCLLAQAKTLRFARLPMMILFSEIQSNADNMLRKIKAEAELCPSNNDAESLLKLGHACVMVDDVYFDDLKRVKILREFVARYPKARYVLSSPQSSATKLGACINPEMPLRFEFVQIREFRRADMRQLLVRDERCTNVEIWLDRLQNEFREINLPFTAANGSILIEILSEKYNFTPINRAVLMEQFVDSTLRKAAIEQSRRETFDYTNKTDLLSHLAAWMAKKDVYVPSKESVRAEMSAYIDSRGLNATLDDLLSEFLSARIFIQRANDCLSFRYRGVLEYFIALRMTSDASFKDWVMEEDRYLRFVNEIQYYAGKLRNDPALVDLVGVRHEAILADALSDIGPIDLGQLESIVLPKEHERDDLNQVAQEVARPPLSKLEKDAELDLEFSGDEEDRQEVFRPKIDQADDRVMLSLYLYSGMIKNMELISDQDKRRHLQVIWQGWSTLLVASLRYAPRLAKERKIRINGALYEVQAPHGMTNSTLLRQMMVHLPTVHLKMLSHALGTEKLERQLTELDMSVVGEPKIFDFFRTGLIAELRLPATPNAIKNLSLNLRKNSYLLWSLIVHVASLRRLDQLSDEHFKALEGPIAEAIANLQGHGHKERVKAIGTERLKLRRERVRLKMKREVDRKRDT